MRSGRRESAGGVQVEKQQRYLQLIAQGVNNSEACRQVGIDRKTGNRWRYGRKVINAAGAVVNYAPVKIKDTKPRSARYLSERERIEIADLLGKKESIRGIAVALGRAASTISREITRNRDVDGAYRPYRAEQRARLRGCRTRQRRIARDPVLRETIDRLLAKRWSPEQVAHELRVVFENDSSRWVCAETIYQAVYDPDVDLTRPCRRRRRRRRLSGPQRRGRICGMRMIAERPVEVVDRAQAGHWEGDLIMGAGNRSAIGTLVERTTRFLILLAFPDGVVTADRAQLAISQAFADLPPQLRRTLTWDQGKELTLHQQIVESTGTDVFFCDAHSPWQRGSNENTNGLLRDYFPKATDLGVHAAEDLARVAAELNDRPRKTLGWRRPGALLALELERATQTAAVLDGAARGVVGSGSALRAIA